MIQWIKELSQKLDNQDHSGYSRLRRLQENKFQGHININFTAGKIKSINTYETTSL